MKKYSVDWFIKEFEKIPASKWIVGSLKDSYGNCCAIGHCVYTLKNAGNANTKLMLLFAKNLDRGPMMINDNGYKGLKTPKGRILRALKDIKKKQKKS